MSHRGIEAIGLPKGLRNLCADRGLEPAAEGGLAEVGGVGVGSEAPPTPAAVDAADDGEVLMVT